MTEEKLVPELRFPEFEGEWEKNKLGKLVKFKKGKGIPKNDLSDYGNKCILYGELYTKYNEIIYGVESYTKLEINKLILSEIGDVLIPSSGETAMEMSLSSALLLENVALGGDINILRPKKKLINSVFLSYQINSARKIELAKIAEGTSVVHLYNSNLEKILIKYPKISEQEKIGSFFYEIDKKIELQEERLEELENYKKAIIQRIFNQEVGFKDENGENYPEWEEKKIEEILKEVNDRKGDNENLRVISSTTNGIFYQEDYFKNRIASENTFKYKILRKNQIVFSPQNIWMGNINFNDSIDIGIVSPSYKIFNISDNFNKLYMKYLIKTPKMIYEYKVSSEQGASVVRRNLNINLFNNIKTKTPSLKEQNKIADFLSLADKKIDLEKEKLENYKQYKKGLIQRMIV